MDQTIRWKQSARNDSPEPFEITRTSFDTSNRYNAVEQYCEKLLLKYSTMTVSE